MVVNDKLNLTMLCDFYELTMGAGYFANGYTDRITYFDLFFRRCPDGGGFAIAAGLEQIVQYIQKLHFDPAIMASPLITTIVDTCSILIYFNVATVVFHL